jgi:hypothetical protein
MANLTAEQKEALKSFREGRGGISDQLLARQKELLKQQRAVRKALAKGPATVPSIAGEIGLPEDETLWFLTLMRKYGEVEEKGQDGDYPLYALIAKNKEVKIQ